MRNRAFCLSLMGSWINETLHLSMIIVCIIIADISNVRELWLQKNYLEALEGRYASAGVWGKFGVVMMHVSLTLDALLIFLFLLLSVWSHKLSKAEPHLCLFHIAVFWQCHGAWAPVRHIRVLTLGLLCSLRSMLLKPWQAYSPHNREEIRVFIQCFWRLFIL